MEFFALYFNANITRVSKPSHAPGGKNSLFISSILYLFLLFQDNMIFEMPNQVVQVGQLIFYKKEKKGTVKSI